MACHRFLGGAFQVGVFDAQDESAFVLARIGPGIQGGAGAADMQVASWAGSEASANHILLQGIKMTILRQS